jgi:uncharacterized membrane protein
LELGTARLQALADGIFAIAMTLLVFELRLPPGTEGDHLAAALAALWPKLASFAVSFLTLGYSWIGHHNQYAVIRRVDRRFLWLNLLFFLAIVLMPFSSVLLGEFPFERVSLFVYCGNMLVAGLLLLLHWSYATGMGKLADGATAEMVTATKRRVLIAPVAYALAMALGLLDVRLGLLVCGVTPLFFALPGRVDRSWSK